MKTTMNIPEDLLKEAVALSQARTRTEAVRRALDEFVKRLRIERMIQRAGNLQFSDDWEEARHAR